jgi:hypothetical protein
VLRVDIEYVKPGSTARDTDERCRVTPPTLAQDGDIGRRILEPARCCRTFIFTARKASDAGIDYKLFRISQRTFGHTVDSDHARPPAKSGAG